MNVMPTDIPDVEVVEPRVSRDTRGYFAETYNDNWPWPGRDFMFSEKDLNHPYFKDINLWC